jgi:hypothetical protein
MSYQPPYTTTPAIILLIAEISEKLGQLSVLQTQENDLRLHRINRIRTIHGSLSVCCASNKSRSLVGCHCVNTS